MSARAAEVPVIAAFSNFRAPAVASPRVCADGA